MITKEINELTTVTTLTTAAYIEIEQSNNSLKTTICDVLNIPSTINALTTVTTLASTDYIKLEQGGIGLKASVSSIICTGTSGTSSYIKLYDNTCIQYGKESVSFACTVTAGSLFAAASGRTVTFPISYTTTPTILMSLCGVGNGQWGTIATRSNAGFWATAWCYTSYTEIVTISWTAIGPI